MLEETGLSVAGYEFFGTFSDPGRVIAYPDGNVFQLASFAYRVRVADPTVLRRSDESTSLRWFSRDELPPEPLEATHRAVPRRYLSGGSPPYLD